MKRQMITCVAGGTGASVMASKNALALRGRTRPTFAGHGETSARAVAS
jgi:hypothetical protein